MARLDRNSSWMDALILEYKLLVTGKIVPDTGESEADIELRLKEIEKILLSKPVHGRAARFDLDR